MPAPIVSPPQIRKTNRGWERGFLPTVLNRRDACCYIAIDGLACGGVEAWWGFSGAGFATGLHREVVSMDIWKGAKGLAQLWRRLERELEPA